MSTDRRIRVIGEDDFSVIEKIDYKLNPKKIYEYVVGFTKIHKKYSSVSKVKREVECLRYMFPKTFQSVKNDQFTIGKFYVMPVGIGCTTTVGGVGYYAQFGSLENLKNQLQDSEEKEILSKFNLRLLTRAGYGLIIEGNEKDKRKCLSFAMSMKNQQNLFEFSDSEREIFYPIPTDNLLSIVTQYIRNSNYILIDGAEKM